MKRGFLNKAKKPVTSNPKPPSSNPKPQPPIPDNLVRTQEDINRWPKRSNLSKVKQFDLHDQQLDYREIHYRSGLTGQIVTDKKILDLLPADHFPPLPPFPKDTFYISSAGGNGLGMFATSDISAYSTIVVENPVVVAPVKILVGPGYSRSDVFERLCARLGEPERGEFLSLSNCEPIDACGTNEGIIRTNSFMTKLKIPRGFPEARARHSAVFINTSRCNHSCGPNASYKFDLESFSLRLYATRPIRAGEEITLAYCGLTKSREARRTQLRAIWSFDCECQYCSVPDVAESDRVREELAQWTENHISFQEWIFNRSLPRDAVTKPNERAIRLLKKEGLDEQIDDYVDTTAMTYGMLADEKNFKKWAEWACKCPGIDPDSILAYKRGLANPKSYYFWGSRA